MIRLGTTSTCTWMVMLVMLHSAIASTEQWVIVDNGRPNATIVVASDAPNILHQTARQLAAYIEQVTGAAVPITTDIRTRGSDVRIVLGHHPDIEAKNIAPIDDDGFEILFLDKRTISIVSPTHLGVEFGVYDFIERYLGVRWLFPGELGEHVPRHATLAVPISDIRQEPAYIARSIGGPGLWTPRRSRGDVASQWSLRHRAYRRIDFHHNLFRLFPPRYRESHPHFFPVIHTERHVSTNINNGWQPRFTADGIVEEAAANIIAYFEENPDASSYSLGINDHEGFDQSTDLEAAGDRVNSLGFHDYSNVYYDWCNQVVEQVLRQHAGKLFGLLAYTQVNDPPSELKLHPHLVPYVTYDRAKWADPELRQKDQQRTRDWAAVAQTVGWYDYIYGHHFLVPRVYFNVMADYLRFGYENNVRAYYAEAYPSTHWHEGPKFYLTLKLLWDPYQDVDALLDDWYTAAVGTDAASYLRKYFSFWEDFWTRRMVEHGDHPQGGWVRFGSIYMPLGQTSYVKWISDAELERCQRWLEQAVEYAQTDTQRRRAQMFLDDYRVRQQAVRSHRLYYEALAVGAEENRWTDAAEMMRQAQAAIQTEQLRPERRHRSHLVRIQVDMAQALERSEQYAAALDAYRVARQMPGANPFQKRIDDGIDRCEKHLSQDHSDS